MSENATFDLYPLRFHASAREGISLSTNLIRGAFGSALKKIAPVEYERFFAPKAIQQIGPSGFGDSPRPFVFRLPEPGIIAMNVFATREPVIDLFTSAMQGIEAIKVEPCGKAEMRRFPLSPTQREITRLRVRFLTPTELKGANQPEFGVLLARIRDRVNALRTLWGAGPLDLDFKAFGERADRVSMTRCELKHVNRERVSRQTGQRHSIGGFTGFAEYEGDLAEFIPYLEIARWSGVGRQTVWGKGEICLEEIEG